MYDVWCDDCCGYLHTIGTLGVRTEFSKSEAQRLAGVHTEAHDHVCIVGRAA